MQKKTHADVMLMQTQACRFTFVVVVVLGLWRWRTASRMASWLGARCRNLKLIHSKEN